MICVWTCIRHYNDRHCFTISVYHFKDTYIQPFSKGLATQAVVYPTGGKYSLVETFAIFANLKFAKIKTAKCYSKFITNFGIANIYYR